VKVLLALSSDQHMNSRQALFPAGVQDDEGIHIDVFKHPVRLALWERWQEFWGLARARADAYDAKLVALFLGDLGDKNKRDPSGLVFKTPALQYRVIKAGLAPVVEAAPDLTVMVRGTIVHVGDQGELEEMAAEWLSEKGLYVARDEANNTWSWWDWAGTLGGVKIHAEHHPKTYGYMPWTEQPGASRESAYISHNCTRTGMDIPDLAVRGHVHYPADSGMETIPRVLFTPPWTFTASTYGHRKGFSLAWRWYGGWFVLCDDGKIDIEPVRWWPERREYWTPDWESVAES